MPSRLTSTIAARAGIAQAELLAQADDAALAVDAAVAKAWRAVLRLLYHPPPHFHLRRQIVAILNSVPTAAHATLQARLGKLYRSGHKAGGHILAGTLPRKVLASRARLTEETNVGPGIRFKTNPRGQLRAEPVVGVDRERLERLLFDPPSQAQVDAILRRPIAGRSWEQDLSQASKVAGFNPDAMAQAIATGFTLGKKPAEIAKDLLPIVDNVKSSARRIARTYGVQVARHGQMQAHAALGNLVIGYMIHSTFSEHTRKWHADRDGTIYYFDPEEGQKGMYQMPNPPLEADDPAERPPDTPHTAYN